MRLKSVNTCNRMVAVSELAILKPMVRHCMFRRFLCDSDDHGHRLNIMDFKQSVAGFYRDQRSSKYISHRNMPMTIKSRLYFNQL